MELEKCDKGAPGVMGKRKVKRKHWTGDMPWLQGEDSSSFLSYFLKTLSIGTVRLRESNPLPPRLHSQYKHSTATDFVGLLEVMYMEIKTKLVHLLQQNLQINSSIVCKVIF